MVQRLVGMAVKQARDSDRLRAVASSKEGLVKPPGNFSYVSKSEDEIEKISDCIDVIGIAPEENPLSVETLPSLFFTKELEGAMRRINPTIAL